MDWEYLYGMFAHGDEARLDVAISVNPPGANYPAQVSLTDLGREGWEMVIVVPYEADLLVFFKRQLPYRVRLSATQKAMLDE